MRGWRGSRLVFWSVLVAALALVAAGIGHWALSAWAFQADEILYRDGARWFVDHLPESLWDQPGYGRGTQRANSWVLGASLAWFGSPDGFVVARWAFVAAFCSTGIPVALWALRLGAGRPAALLAGVFSVLVPWAVVTSTFLTESLAYPAFVWAAFAIWHAAVRRGAWADVLALAAIVGAALCRSGLLVLFVVLPLVLLAQALMTAGGPGVPRTVALRRGMRDFLRGHAVLIGAMVVGLVALGVVGGAGLSGNYSTGGFRWTGWEALWSALRGGGAVLAVGMAFAPLAVAGAFCARQLVRPADQGTLALSLVAIATVGALLWSRTIAGVDERYLMYLAPLAFLCCAVGLTRREVRWPAVVVAGVVLAWFTLQATWRDIGPFGFQSFPAETFASRVLGLGVGGRLPGGLDAGQISALAGIGAVGLVVVALVVRGRWRVGLLAVAVTAVGLTMAAELRYSLSHFSQTSGGPPVEARSWVDQRTGSDAVVGVYATPTPGVDLAPYWTDVRYYNVAPRVSLQAGGDAGIGGFDRAVDVRVDERTGRLVAAAAAAVPSLVLVPRAAVAAPLAGRVIGGVPSVPIDLVDAGPHPSVRHLLSGADGDGWIRHGREARLRVFAVGAGQRCLDVRILGAPGETAPVRYAVESGGIRRTGTVQGDTPVVATVPVTPSRGRGPADVRITREGRLPMALAADGTMRLFVDVGAVRGCR